MGLRIGVIGTGRLGREHVRILSEIPDVDFVGCYDVDADRCNGVAAQFGAEPFRSLDALLRAVEAVSVVVPTVRHAEVSLAAMEMGRDVFLEKPLAASTAEAGRLVAEANEADLILQVGHVERFNAVIQRSLEMVTSPSFIEIERLSPFSLRGTDVSVVMDLMIHDLDLLLLMVGEWPCEIRAKGAGVLTPEPDIVNTRLEFPGGCVADLTASRVSAEASRKIRVFSHNHYLSIDLLEARVKHYCKGEKFKEAVAMLRNSPGTSGTLTIDRFLDVDEFTIEGEEPLRVELSSFCRSVLTRTRPPVTGEDGLRVLRLAEEILEKIKMDSLS